MEKILRTIPQVSIYGEKEELDSLVNDEDFITFILNESLAAIKQAIKNNEKEFCLLEISNLECKLIVKRKDFKKILEKIIEKFASSENYEGCKEISDIIKKL